MLELSVAEGLQVYVVAPVAFSVATPPLQMVVLVGVIVKLGVTVTVDVLVAVQPDVFPVTV